MKFQEMNLDPSLIHGLKNMGMTDATKIQEQAIPQILSSNDTHIIAQARTGSGKTIAFSVPIAQLIDSNIKEVQCIIIVPTRELCKQVADVFSELTKHHSLNVVQVYGGVSIDRQIVKIRDGIHVIVATPGRLIDIYNRHRVSFKHVKHVVLDEADRCLDMGFMPDIEFLLLDAMKDIKPLLYLFSATMLDAIVNLGQRFTHGKNVLEINVSQDAMTVDNCNQYYYEINDFKDKYYHFVRIYKKERPSHSMIFVNTKKTGDWLYNRLLDEKYLSLKIELISGNLTQKRREIVIDQFRKKKINCLIATDVAARGLDIDKVSHVFNYDLPEFEENYVHRIGRTARISNSSGKFEKGIAITLVMSDQIRILARIEGFMQKNIERRPLPLRNQKYSQYSNNRNDNRHQNNQREYQKTSYNRNTNKRPNNSDEKKPNRRNFLY